MVSYRNKDTPLGDFASNEGLARIGMQLSEFWTKLILNIYGIHLLQGKQPIHKRLELLSEIREGIYNIITVIAKNKTSKKKTSSELNAIAELMTES